jgi:hypothetical protein
VHDVFGCYERSLVGLTPTVESAKGWDVGKRFIAAICVAVFVFAACGTAATRDAGIVPEAQAPAATSAPALVTSAPVTGAPAAPTASPATVVTQPPATAAPVTQAPVTRAPATAATTPKPVGVVFTSVKSPVSRNSTGSVTVSTAPNISCTITVTYKSGPSEAQGLVPKVSNAAGAATWTWNIGGNTTLGTWPIDVTCGGASGRATFVVQ